MKRIFIAFSVPLEIEPVLIDIQKKIKLLYPKLSVNWIGRRNFHLTLDFLSSLEEEQILKTQEVLNIIVPNYPQISFCLDEIGGFPNLYRPSVLALKIFDSEKIGSQLREDVVKKLKEQGVIETSRSWKAHITLGRVKKISKINNLEKIDIPKTCWKSQRVVLYESILGKEGPTYRAIEKYNLNKK